MSARAPRPRSTNCCATDDGAAAGQDTSGAAKFLWLYFGFRGSIGRREYRLANPLILACYIAAFRLVDQIDLPGGLSGSLSNLFGVLALAALWCVFALAAKRVHDLGFPTPSLCWCSCRWS